MNTGANQKMTKMIEEEKVEDSDTVGVVGAESMFLQSKQKSEIAGRWFIFPVINRVFFM